MGCDEKILNVCDDKGNIQAVIVPLDLWKKLEPYYQKLAETQTPSIKEDLKAFEEFLHYWDFRYPYDPYVECPCCHAFSKDWRKDQDKPFYLKNANIGGLLVFHCKNCGATIRHKYFRDRMAVEFSPAG